MHVAHKPHSSSEVNLVGTQVLLPNTKGKRYKRCNIKPVELGTVFRSWSDFSQSLGMLR